MAARCVGAPEGGGLDMGLAGNSRDGWRRRGKSQTRSDSMVGPEAVWGVTAAAVA